MARPPPRTVLYSICPPGASMRWTLIQPFSGDSSAAITRDVLWPADPAQCCLRGNGRVQLFVVADLAAAEVGLDRARRHRIHGDTSRAQLLGSIAREHFDRSLHRGIRRAAWIREAGQAARDIDDPTAVGQQRQPPLGQEKRPFELHVHQLVELFFGGFGERRVRADACIVDQEIETVALPTVA